MSEDTDTFDLLDDDRDPTMRQMIFLEIDNTGLHKPFVLDIEGKKLAMTARQMRKVVLRLNALCSQIWIEEGVTLV